jgi:hypothetical protein
MKLLKIQAGRSFGEAQANARIITDLHGESTSLDMFNFQHRMDFPRSLRQSVV